MSFVVKSDQNVIPLQTEINYRIFLAVNERVLGFDERPWEIIKRIGHESIRQAELLRFCLQPARDPHGPRLALFVGNLPPGLSERNYENMLMEYLGKGKNIITLNYVTVLLTLKTIGISEH